MRKCYSILFGILCSMQLANASGTTMAGKIYYHLSFPVNITEQTERLELTENYLDLIMANFVAGAMYGHLIHKYLPEIKFNQDYLYGSLLAQLLQENLETSQYVSTSDYINPDPQIRKMLLAPAQGGPYQINDYSKRLEHGYGLINFVVLRKSLGYSTMDQDSGKQTGSIGPDSLDNKYFGPLAAAYFQFNDLLRLEGINKDPWGPEPEFVKCLDNFRNQDSRNFLDMILNAAYNAGPWADITKTYGNLCAHFNETTYKEKIDNINNYYLDDKSYQEKVGTKEQAGTTFILYPRQIRYYLDQLYNNNPSPLHTTNSLPVNLTSGDINLRNIFAECMHTLSYFGQIHNELVFIDKQVATSAFDAAIAELKITSSTLDITNKDERQKIFALLDLAINKLEQNLTVDFGALTEDNH